jgi:S1-C subfamily serine protease
MASACGSATTTAYRTQTAVVPVSVDCYDFLAFYLAKVKYVFDGQYRNLSSEESKQLGSVNGVVLVSVIHGSPAAATGFLPGDIITKLNGQAVTDSSQFNELLIQSKGQRVTLTTFRNGKPLERQVTMANF